MKRLIVYSLLVMMIASCTAPNKFIVTNLGYEPEEMEESLIYALPKNSLKVSLTYEKNVVLPGPYADYALKLLGIEDVAKERYQHYRIVDQSLKVFSEPDIEHFYSLNVIEGEFSALQFNKAIENGLILSGNYNSRSSLNIGGKAELLMENPFVNLTQESNVEMKRQTIYKTILTDTSFIKVPVTTEQLQRKTLEKKAEEAANLILEIRSDRYYLSAGLVDPYPSNFDLKIALEGLDKLEDEYLSLFIGKRYKENATLEYYVSPSGSVENEVLELDFFTSENGFGLTDGEPLTLMVKPSGEAQSLRNLLPQEPEDSRYNCLYYRVPDLTDVTLLKGSQMLLHERMSIYQCGALVSEKF